jgi:hypothetical protein
VYASDQAAAETRGRAFPNLATIAFLLLRAGTGRQAAMPNLSNEDMSSSSTSLFYVPVS